MRGTLRTGRSLADAKRIPIFCGKSIGKPIKREDNFEMCFEETGSTNGRGSSLCLTIDFYLQC